MRRSRLLTFRTQMRLLCSFIILILINTVLYTPNNEYETNKQTVLQITEAQARRTHFAIVNDFMKHRKSWITSNLGSWLFKYDTDLVPKDKIFYVYANKKLFEANSPLHDCSVENCIFTGEEHKIPMVDAVAINLHRAQIPTVAKREPGQLWIFMSEESPKHTFNGATTKIELATLADKFNWSMTYRSDADIPIPYGRVVPLNEPLFKYPIDTSAIAEVIPYWKSKRRDILVVILMSNCLSHRTKFISALQKHIPVDVIGKCATNLTLTSRCPGHHERECKALSQYVFYLALENSFCREYMTEKIFYNAYMNGAIPIVRGPSINDCNRFLPPNSFLYVYPTFNKTEIKELADTILHLSEDDDSLLSFHKWRNHFTIVNEHGYFGRKSKRLCRLCQGLNYNDMKPKVYNENDIRNFLDPSLSCGKKNV